MINNRTGTISRVYLALLSCIGWFALVGQFVVMVQNRGVSMTESLIRFFSYFTILSNILVTVCGTVLVVWPGTRMGKWLSGASPQTAIAVYIAVVGLVYNLVLRSLYELHGLHRLVNELLHVWVPLLYVFFWVVWTRKEGLSRGDVPGWLVYPAVYALYVLVRGAFAGWYPYPFLDVNQLGYGRVLLNSGGLVLVFLFCSLLPVAVAVAARRRRS